MADPMAGTAARCALLRWVGMAAFVVAAVAFAGLLAAAATGRAPWSRVPLGVVAMGISLGAFGVNDDTFLHALGDLHRRGVLPARWAAEWERERKARPARALHASPKMAAALPVAALALVGWAGLRAAQAWGVG